MLARVSRIQRLSPEVRPNRVIRELSSTVREPELQLLAEQLETLEELFKKARIHENPWHADGTELRSDRYSLDEINEAVDRLLERTEILDQWAGRQGPESESLEGDPAAVADSASSLAESTDRLSPKVFSGRPKPETRRIEEKDYRIAATAARQFEELSGRTFRWFLWSFHRSKSELRRFGSARSWSRSSDSAEHLKAIAARADAVAHWETAFRETAFRETAARTERGGAGGESRWRLCPKTKRVRRYKQIAKTRADRFGEQCRRYWLTDKSVRRTVFSIKDR